MAVAVQRLDRDVLMKNLLHKAQGLSVTQKIYTGFGVVLLIRARMASQALAAGQISDSMSQLNETAQQTAESLRQSGQAILQLKDATQRLHGGVSRIRVSAA
jgi:methyl-accepting chemotaxis protein